LPRRGVSTHPPPSGLPYSRSNFATFDPVSGRVITEKGLEQLRFDPAKAQPANAADPCR